MNSNYSMTINKLEEKVSVKEMSLIDSLFRRILYKYLDSIEIGELTIIENGQEYVFGKGHHEYKASLEITDPAAFSMIILGGDIGAAKAFMQEYWCSDDLVALIRLFIRNKHLLSKISRWRALLKKPSSILYNMIYRNTHSGSRKNIEAHYDLSNDFYKLFLDETMNYSCGIFPAEKSSMKDASIEKMDRICKKLDLKPEDNVLEIGTGWGGMAVYAAKNYGCRVTTTTISNEQYSYVKELIRNEDLEDRITLLNKDYRELTGEFDKIVSVEMIEAVGYEYIPEFLKTCDLLLENDGIMVMQGITMNEQHFDQYLKTVDFIQKYIFPGACLISVSHVLSTLKKKTALNLVNLEDITPHYAETLNEWRNGFMENLDEVRKLGFSEHFINMWEYYFCSCEAGFRERHIGDIQMTFAKPGNRRDPILGVI
ncbi:class I SAM-dependent methyltransferase [candidate division KSB1 bacterium]